MRDAAYEVLAQADPLSEIRFVHDYLQLVFWPHTLSLYPKLEVHAGGRRLTSSDNGYFDSICRLIGQKLVAVTREEKMRLSFRFASGTSLLVSLRPGDAVGPEVAMLADDKGGLMVERYDD